MSQDNSTPPLNIFSGIKGGFLFRGVNAELHHQNAGRLVPKAPCKPFKSDIYWGGGTYWNDGSVYGESERNTVIQHQRDSSKHETSGISTTPIFEIACDYATHKGKHSGYVYKIDFSMLEKLEVAYHVVDEHATQPTIPGDKEVILVAKDFGVLPSEIVVEVIEIALPDKQPETTL